MKKLTLLLFIVFTFSCDLRLSTEELTEQVKESIIEQFAENDEMKMTLVDLSLVHKGGNEYRGYADVIIENPVADLLNEWSEADILNKNIEYRYSVDVIYDGEMFSWEFQTE